MIEQDAVNRAFSRYEERMLQVERRFREDVERGIINSSKEFAMMAALFAVTVVIVIGFVMLMIVL